MVGAIPARYASTRLPGKPLLSLAGRPMIEHVYRRARSAAALDAVVVLTDDPRIVEAVEAFGGDCQLTPEDCASGTDRIAWAAKAWGAHGVVNIQGDEPLIDPVSIDAVARHLRQRPEDEMVTLAAPAEGRDMADPNCVKVVVDRSGHALYFSRSPLPYERQVEIAPRRKHIGIYGYRTDILLRLAGLEPTLLERAESLEQLRALEHGIRIRVLDVERAEPGVDTADDLARAEALLIAELSGRTSSGGPVS